MRFIYSPNNESLEIFYVIYHSMIERWICYVYLTIFFSLLFAFFSTKTNNQANTKAPSARRRFVFESKTQTLPKFLLLSIRNDVYFVRNISIWIDWSALDSLTWKMFHFASWIFQLSYKITLHLNYLIQLFLCFEFRVRFSSFFYSSYSSSYSFDLDFPCQTNDLSNAPKHKKTMMIIMFLYVLGGKSLFFPLLLLLQTPQVILVEIPWLKSKYGISAHWTNSIKVFQAFFSALATSNLMEIYVANWLLIQNFRSIQWQH